MTLLSMNPLSRLFALAAILAAACLISGCASSEGDNLLTKAGFDPVRADTTAQVDALKKLSADGIYVVHRNGRTFYVLTDPPGGLIFVGTEADFARYRKIRASGGSRTQEAELPLVENQSALILSAWGGWRGWDA
jgi:hypothetical protein